MSWVESLCENWGERYRHLKRGSTYVKMGVGELQAASPVVEGVAVVIYRSEKDGRLWVRPEEEFNDGRFVKIIQDQE